MSKKFFVTFYQRGVSMLLMLVLGALVLGAAFAWLKLSGTGTAGFLGYAAIVVSGVWSTPKLVKRWTLLPSEVSINEDGIAIENLTTREVLAVSFAEVWAYRLTDYELLLCLQDGRKMRFRIAYKFYNPGSFDAMTYCLAQTLRMVRGSEITRLP